MGERALALLPFSDTPLEGSVLTALCGPLQAAGHFDELSRRIARARALLFDRDLSGQDIALSARVGAASFSNLSVFQGYRFEPRWVDYCLWAAEQIQKPDFFNQAWVNPAIWYAWSGRHDEAAELIGKITQNCRKIGAPPFPWILYLRPYLAWQRGGSDEAMAQINQALHYPHLERLRLAYESVWVLKGHVHLSLDDPADADAAFEAVEERARTRGMELIAAQAWIGRGQVAFHRRDIPGARALLEAALRQSQAGPARNPLHVALACRHLGEVARAQGDYATALAHFERALEIVRTPEQDNLIEQGYLHLARSGLARSQGHFTAAQADLKRASTCFQQIGNAYCLRLVARCQG
jgi:tetratricopeptide (TPR) repeat protein